MRKIRSSLCAAVLIISMIVTIAVPPAFAYNETVVDDENIISLGAQSAILVDADSGNVLYEYNADERHGPASVTKVMTLLLIFEAMDRGEFTLDDMVTASAYAASLGGSQIYLEEGEQLSVRDLIKSIVVASGNDAAVAMSEFVAGSTYTFVAQMNARARELGMNNTNFVNCHGLDDPDHYTSARDISLMALELIRHREIFDYTTLRTDTIRNGSFELTSTNKLLRTYDGITGLKTGSTSTTLYSMCATAERDGTSLLAVVMASPTGDDRFKDAAALLDYGFANYVHFLPPSERLDNETVSVKRGQDDFVGLKLADSNGVTLKSRDTDRVETSLILPDSIKAPVTEGEQIGLMVCTVDGETVLEVPIVAAQSVERLNMKFSILALLQELFSFIWGR